MKGWVYVISNLSMPGMVKVGFSMKDPAIRADDLDSTGMPTPYVVEYEALVEDPYRVEQLAHSQLSGCHAGKEWFKADKLAAALVIRKCADAIIFENFREFSEYELDREQAERDCRAERIRFTEWCDTARDEFNSDLESALSSTREGIEKKYTEIASDAYLISRSQAHLFGAIAGLVVAFVWAVSRELNFDSGFWIVGAVLAGLGRYIGGRFSDWRNESIKRSGNYIAMMGKMKSVIEEENVRVVDEFTRRYESAIAEEKNRHLRQLDLLSEPLSRPPPRIGYYEWKP